MFCRSICELFSCDISFFELYGGGELFDIANDGVIPIRN
jgi:hypothetical protein